MFFFNSLNNHALKAIEDYNGTSLSCDARALLSSAAVGVQVSLLLAPLELVRIQGQNQNKGGLLEASRHVASVAREGGVSLSVSFCRGMTATMHRESKYCMGQFFLCSWVERQLRAALADESRPNGGEEEAGSGLGLRVVSAMGSGFVCTILSHPDDVVKTRMQTHITKGTPEFEAYRSYTQTIRTVVKEEGFRGLWRGAFFRCVIRVPLGLTVIAVVSSHVRPHADAAVARLGFG